MKSNSTLFAGALLLFGISAQAIADTWAACEARGHTMENGEPWSDDSLWISAIFKTTSSEQSLEDSFQGYLRGSFPSNFEPATEEDYFSCRLFAGSQLADMWVQTEKMEHAGKVRSVAWPK
jgi:hypothetical protein